MVQEKLLAGVACRLLQIVTGLAHRAAHIGLAKVKGQRELFGQRSRETGILARFFTAQLMIQVQNAQMQIPARRQLEQNVQQANGVRAARHRHTHALACPEHVVAGDGMDYALEHSPILAPSAWERCWGAQRRR